jgi:hypothetical protein
VTVASKAGQPCWLLLLLLLLLLRAPLHRAPPSPRRPQRAARMPRLHWADAKASVVRGRTASPKASTSHCSSL